MAVLATCHPFLARSRGNCGAAGMLADLFCMPTSYALHCLRLYRLQVTCGSVIKLQHSNTGVNLHSHEISYGSGSGQQSVTGFTGGDDANDYWSVRGIEVYFFLVRAQKFVQLLTAGRSLLVQQYLLVKHLTVQGLPCR